MPLRFQPSQALRRFRRQQSPESEPLRSSADLRRERKRGPEVRAVRLVRLRRAPTGVHEGNEEGHCSGMELF